jgi:hypothetical protein
MTKDTSDRPKRQHVIVSDGHGYEFNDAGLERIIPHLRPEFQVAARAALGTEQAEAKASEPRTGTLTVTSLQAAREKRTKVTPRGNCARGFREECGMIDARDCVVHGPYCTDDGVGK